MGTYDPNYWQNKRKNSRKSKGSRRKDQAYIDYINRMKSAAGNKTVTPGMVPNPVTTPGITQNKPSGPYIPSYPTGNVGKPTSPSKPTTGGGPSPGRPSGGGSGGNPGDIPYGNDAVTPHPSGGYVPTNIVPSKPGPNGPVPNFGNVPAPGGGDGGGGGGGGGGDFGGSGPKPPKDWEGDGRNWYLQKGMQQAAGLYRDEPSPTPWSGSTVPDFNRDSQNAMASLRQWGQRGSNTTRLGENALAGNLSGNSLNNNPLGYTQGGRTAENALSKTTQGAYLNNNPYLDAMYNKSAKQVSKYYKEGIRPGIDSQASLAGRYGSGSHNRLVSNARYNLGETLGNLATNVYGGNYARERGNQQAATLAGANLYGNTYNAERGRQVQSLALSPAIRGMRASDVQGLGKIGSAQEQRNAQKLAEEKANWTERRDAPWLGFNRYTSALSQLNTGRTGALQKQSYSSGGGGLSGLLGGALTGYGAAGTAGALTAAGAVSGPVGWGLIGLGAAAGYGQGGR